MNYDEMFSVQTKWENVAEPWNVHIILYFTQLAYRLWSLLFKNNSDISLLNFCSAAAIISEFSKNEILVNSF